MMVSLDVPKLQRRVWQLCGGCVPDLVLALEKPPATTPAPELAPEEAEAAPPA